MPVQLTKLNTMELSDHLHPDFEFKQDEIEYIKHYNKIWNEYVNAPAATQRFKGTLIYRWRQKGHGGFYGTTLWQRLRKAAKARDKQRCQECIKLFPGITPQYGLHVHHIKAMSDGGSPFNLDNLICLCEKHHWEAERPMREKRQGNMANSRNRAWLRMIDKEEPCPV